MKKIVTQLRHEEFQCPAPSSENGPPLPDLGAFKAGLLSTASVLVTANDGALPRTDRGSAERDSFRVNFNAYFFRNQWDKEIPEWELMDNPFNGEDRFCATSRKELTVEIFVTEYPHLLAYLCRRAVLENAPFELTRETIKHYGFSREDVKLLRDCIASNNRRIIDELREEYERLKAIDCLQVVPPKRRGRKPKAEVSAEIQPIAKKPRTRISRKKFVPTRSVKS